MVKGSQVPCGRRSVNESQKNCFGILEKVFPVGREGLREIFPSCFDCPDRKACLQSALVTKTGLMFRSEVLDRAPAKGLVGRFRRWSEKKELSRLLNQKEGNGK